MNVQEQVKVRQLPAKNFHRLPAAAFLSAYIRQKLIARSRPQNPPIN